MKIKQYITAFVLCLTMCGSFALSLNVAVAQPSPTINYQGKLTDATGVAVANGTYNMRFYLYNATGGATTSAIWTEVLTGSNQVQVTNGLFSVMLGSTTALTSVDFNQALYLGVEIGGTGAASWDGEMSPRKMLGTVPAAFESFKLGGVASSSFLRSDQGDIMSANTASSLLTLRQYGAGSVLSLLDGSANNLFTVTASGQVGIGTTTMDRLLNVAGASNAGARFTDTTNQVKVDVRSEDFQGFIGTVSNHDLRFITNNTSRLSVTNAGNVGVGTTSPYANLSVAGNIALTGGIYDNNATRGTNGQILKTTGTGVQWVATSTLGFASYFSTSAQLAALLSDETGTGNVVFSNNPVLVTPNLGTPSAAILTNATGLPISTGVSGLGTDIATFLGAPTTANFALALTGETGTGNVVFSNSPTFTGSPILPSGFTIGANTFNRTGAHNLTFTTTAATTLTLPTSGTVAVTTSAMTGTFDGNNFVGGAIGTGDILYGSAAGSINELAGVATGNVLISGGVATAPAWGKVGLTTHVSGTLAGANGGTGLNTITQNQLLIGGAGNTWTQISTSSLGISGTTLFTGLTDTQSSLTANRVLFTNGGGTALTDSAGFTFNGSQLTVGGKVVSSSYNATSSTLGYQINGVTIATGSSTKNNFAFAGASYIPTNVGSNNISMGIDALKNATGGNNNFTVGFGSLGGLSAGSTGNGNTAIGSAAMGNNTSGFQNIAIGGNSLFSNTSGSNNLALGGLSAQFYNVNGSNNTALGYKSLNNNQTGNANVAIGPNTLLGTFGNSMSSSTALGSWAGKSNTTGNNNLYLGDEADGLAGNYTNSTAIGSHAKVGASNTIVLGGTGGWAANVGIGTTTPYAKLSVTGDIALTGGIYDNSATRGTNGKILQTTGTGVQWVATSSLGISGTTLFTGLTDTQSSLTANRVLFTNSGGTALTDSSGFTFNGSQLTVGGNIVSSSYNATSSTLGYQINGVTIASASTTKNNYFFGSAAISSAATSGFTFNIAMGLNAMQYATSGMSNIAIGTNSLKGPVSVGMTGSYNTALGSTALFSNTTGSYNQALGRQALASNTSGYSNNAFGRNSLYSNTTGSYNNAFGEDSLIGNMTGSSLNAIGWNSLRSTTGASSTALGAWAGKTNITGNNNLYLGDEADALAGTYSNSAAIGSHAKVGASNAIVLGGTGSWAAKVGIGTTTPYAKLSVTGDIALTGGIYDSSATRGTNGKILQTTGTGVQWVATSSLGISGTTLFTGLTDTQSSLTANRVLFTNGGGTALTDSAGFTYNGSQLSVGGNVSAQSYNATSSTLGYQINGVTIATGSSTKNNYSFAGAAYIPTNVGSNNISMGIDALKDATGGNDNFAAGNRSLGGISGANTGSGNTAIGSLALASNYLGNYNVAIGSNSLAYNDTGSNNLSFGQATLFNNINGSNNTALGYRSLFNNFTGNANVAIGPNALYGTFGNSMSSSTALGAWAGKSNTTGNNNLYLGDEADALAGTYSNSAAIGSHAKVGASNSIVLGGTGSWAANVGIGTTSPSAKLTIKGTAGSANTLLIASSTGATTLAMLANGNLELPGQFISAGISWTNSTAAEANAWRSAVYGNGLFVAVSNSGTNRVMTSPDGINWTARAATAANQWYSVTYGNGLFVAVSTDGTNRVMTSPDGITWTARTAAAANPWQSVTYGNGLFVAVSNSGTNRVMTSPDGITWTARTAAAANSWYGITYGNGLFVAVAGDGVSRVMTSSDGINWTPRTAAEANSWSSVTYGNGLFVAVTQAGTNQVMTSPNGITWTARAATEANPWNSVTYGNGLFVAVSNTGTNRIMTSTDGTIWTRRTASSGNAWYAVTYGNGKFVALAIDGAVMTSGKTSINTLAHNNIYQGGMSVFGGAFNIGTTTSFGNPAHNNILNVASTTGSSLLTMLANGNIGIGTTSPYAKLSVTGNIALTGGIYDNNATRGTNGKILQTTGTGVQWVATSSLGISGTTLFTGLTDTQSSLTANRVLFTNSGGTALTDSAGFTFNGSQLTVGGNIVSSSYNATSSTLGYQINGVSALIGSTTLNNFFMAGANPTSYTNGAINNYAIGDSALQTLTTGDRNIAIGSYALYGSSTAGMSGNDNIALGASAMWRNSTGSYNNALGSGALGNSNTTGSYNNALGYETLTLNTTGSYNNALGYRALVDNTTGSENNAFGWRASNFNTTGSYNNAFGRQALYSNISGSNNVAIGNQALLSATTKSSLIAIGWKTLRNTTGASSTALGTWAGQTNTTGNNNLYLGDEADALAGTYSNSAAIGSHAKVGASNSIVLGGTGAWAANVGIGTTSPFARLSVDGGTLNSASTFTSIFLKGTNNNSALTYKKGGNISIIGGAYTGSDVTGYGGDVSVVAGVGKSVGGNLMLNGGDGVKNVGGEVIITGGDGKNIGGNLTLSSGMGTTSGLGTSGDVNILTKNSAGGSSGSGGITLTTGNGNYAGVITLQGGNGASSGNAGSIVLSAGKSLDAMTYPGSIVLNPGGGYATGSIQLASNFGNVGIGTTSPYAKLSVTGNIALTGGIYDNTATRGTNGQILQTTGTGVQWVATSSLGISGTTLFTGLTDTQSSLTANRVLFTNGGGTALTDSAGFTFNGSQLTVGGKVVSSSFNATSSTLGYQINGVSALIGSTTLNNFFMAGANPTSYTNGAINNYAIGDSALQTLTTGDRNIAIGSYALYGSSTAGMSGTDNVALGASAMWSNTTGSNNNALGNSALGNNNTTGSNNNALGYEALTLNTTGSYNNALGYRTLVTNSTGSDNNAFGWRALDFNTTGSNNNAFGHQALYSNISGSNNVAIGNQALLFATTKSSLNAIGWKALYNTTGASSTALGTWAGQTNTTGNNNLYLGDEADALAGTYSNSTAIGSHAKVGASNSIVLGGTGAWSANIGIGTTSPSAKLTIKGTAGSANTLLIASSTGATTLAMLANGNLELPGQFISAGINWTARSAAGDNDSWQSVAYGNGLFVAVGGFGDRVMTSPDGIIWTARSAAGDNDTWLGVTYGNGLFVAVGDAGDRVMTSPDGINWTARSAAGNNDDWTSVTYGNGLFVAVATDNDGSSDDVVMTSPDGINWTARTTAETYNWWSSVTYGNGLFVAVGVYGDNRVITSPDGITWTPRTAAEANSWNSVAYGNGLFVAVSSSGADNVMTSPDGITWTARSAADGAFRSITYGNGLFVAVGATDFLPGARIITSSDGINWTTRTAAGDDDLWSGVTYGNGIFVMVNEAGNDFVMTSGKTTISALAHNNIYQGGTSFMGGLRAGTTTSAVASVFLQGEAGKTPFAISSSTGSRLLTLTQSGNLGIGTSSPYAKLSVAGNVVAQSYNATSSTLGYQINGVTIATGSSTKNNFAFAGASYIPTNLGTYNIALGKDTLKDATGGNYNFAAVNGALGGGVGGNSGSNNTAIGFQSLNYNQTGSSNTAIGGNAMTYNISGSNNLVLGSSASYYGNGSQNIALGFGSLFNNSSGNANVAIGPRTLFGAFANSMSSSTALGAWAGKSNTSGNNNLYLGDEADASAGTYSNSAAIGSHAKVGASNAIVLGGTGSWAANVGIGVTAPSAKLYVKANTGVYNAAIFEATCATCNTNINVFNAGSTAGNSGSQIDFSVGASATVFGSVRGTALSATDGALSFLTRTSGTPTEKLRIDNLGNVGIGTTSPSARLSLQRTAFSGTGVVGLDQYLDTQNTVASAVQYGNRFYLNASNTATTTIVGSIFRIKDSTTYGNTVRGLEVQTNKGVNTKGENTALSGFARTFGVRGYTSADAGASFEPAGGYFETGGTTQGNAVRGYSSSITTATLLSLFQDSSNFSGTGLEMNFGNTTGSFASTTSKYLDFQNAGVSVFTVSAYGTTTIGDGSTNHMAGLQIGYGGICVDNDGSCNASTTGRITAVETQTGNSDLAETYFSSTNLEPGEIVVLKGGLSIDRATKESSTPILGVVSTKPGLTLGFDDESLVAGEKAYPIALSGRVPIKLSNENGEIKRGDQLMLSSLSGVAMKATGTGATIGIALEDFDESRQYSDTYINQFGDDMVDPVYEPVFTNADPRINDGCYYSGGRATGEEPCVPLLSTTSDAQITEVNKIIKEEGVQEALEELELERSNTKTLADGRTVKVGRVVMFVNLGYRWFDENQMASLGALMGTSSITNVGENEDETIFDRLVQLANSFVDGVLSIFELRVNRIEVANELCVDGVCLNASDLRQLLDNAANNTGTANVVDTVGDTENGTTTTDGQTEDEPVVTEEDVVVEDTTGTSTEEVIEEEIVEDEVVDGTETTDTGGEEIVEDVVDDTESTSDEELVTDDSGDTVTGEEVLVPAPPTPEPTPPVPVTTPPDQTQP